MTRYGGYSSGSYAADRAKDLASERAERARADSATLDAVGTLGGAEAPVKLQDIATKVENFLKLKSGGGYRIASGATQRLKRAGKLRFVPGVGSGWMLPTQGKPATKAKR